MARESLITLEQVATAANELKSRGIKPTSRSIRESVGSGSMATILKFFQQWQSEQQIRQIHPIDETLDPSIAKVISSQMASKVQQATAEAVSKLADLQTETDSLISENEKQTAEIEALTTTLAKTQELLAACNGRIQQLEADAKRTADALDAERKLAETARIGQAKAELRLETLPYVEAELTKLRAELDEARTKSSNMHEVAAVAEAKLEFAQAALLDAREARIKAETQLAENLSKTVSR